MQQSHASPTPAQLSIITHSPPSPPLPPLPPLPPPSPDGPDAELEELLGRLTAAVRLLYGPPGATWVVGAELDELASLSGLEAGDVEALPAGYK